jgi:predicted ATP-dependent serine protease
MERARAGDGQLVMIVGEPGMGKSRLIEEFHARAGGLRGNCLSVERAKAARRFRRRDGVTSRDGVM